MDRSMRWLRQFWNVPRLYVTILCAGVAIGSLNSIYFGMTDFVALCFIWIGLVLVLRLVWSSDLTWPQVFRRGVFWGAIALIIAGNLIAIARLK